MGRRGVRIRAAVWWRAAGSGDEPTECCVFDGTASPDRPGAARPRGSVIPPEQVSQCPVYVYIMDACVLEKILFCSFFGSLFPGPPGRALPRAASRGCGDPIRPSRPASGPASPRAPPPAPRAGAAGSCGSRAPARLDRMPRPVSGLRSRVSALSRATRALLRRSRAPMYRISRTLGPGSRAPAQPESHHPLAPLSPAARRAPAIYAIRPTAHRPARTDVSSYVNPWNSVPLTTPSCEVSMTESTASSLVNVGSKLAVSVSEPRLGL